MFRRDFFPRQLPCNRNFSGSAAFRRVLGTPISQQRSRSWSGSSNHSIRFFIQRNKGELTMKNLSLLVIGIIAGILVGS